MRILVIWQPYPDAQVHEDGYQDSRQVIMKDGYQRVDDFGELIGKRIKDVRRNEQDDIIFELSEDKEIEMSRLLGKYHCVHGVALDGYCGTCEIETGQQDERLLPTRRREKHCLDCGCFECKIRRVRASG